MKISDEIREWWGSPASCKELLALADRIDSEMVELPKDKDGEPIHVGDTIYDSAGDDGIVTSFSVHCEGFDIFVDGNSSHDHMPSHYTHERPDSLERIAAELEGLSVDSSDNYYVSTHCSKLADRIRRLAEKESER